MGTRLENLAEYCSPTRSGTLSERAWSIRDEDIIEPSMPVGVFGQEAFCIYRFAQDDRETLESVGLDWRIVEELPARIDLLRQAEAQWWHARYSEHPVKRKYRDIKQEADDVRDELIRDLKFALHDDTSYEMLIKNIEQADSSSDYYQDMNDLVHLARKHTDALAEIGSDISRIERLHELCKRLRKMNMEYINADFDIASHLTNRNKAYTFLLAALGELRRCADHALWNTPQRRKGYSSEYFRKSSRRPRPRKAGRDFKI
jgi:hypothetical protein